MANSGITKIEFIDAGFKAILTSDGCHEVIEQTAQQIADKANANNDRGGEGFGSSTKVGGYGGGRWIGFVTATDQKAAAAESEDKALTRALT